MRELATPNGSKLPEPRGIRYSIRALMLVAALVCLAAATYASFESVPFTMFDRGEDTVISTAEFEIVLLGQQFNGQPMNGQFLFGGLWRRGGPHRLLLGNEPESAPSNDLARIFMGSTSRTDRQGNLLHRPPRS